MLRSVLCKIGFHEWTPWIDLDGAFNVISRAFYGMKRQVRHCVWCSKMDSRYVVDDKQTKET